MFGVDERFGLGVAVGRYGASPVNWEFESGVGEALRP
jgi:hypothetical protein